MTKNGKKQQPKPFSFKQLGSEWQELAEERRQLILALFLAVILAVIIVPKGGLTPDYYRPGDIAGRDIKAPADLNILDEVLSEKKRVEAERAVLPLYDFDPSSGRAFVKALDELFRSPVSPQEEAGVEVQPSAEQLLQIEINDKELQLLNKLGTNPEQALKVTKALVPLLKLKILGNLELYRKDLEKGVVLRNLESAAEVEVRVDEGAIGVDQVTPMLLLQLKQIKVNRGIDLKQLAKILTRGVRPNLTFNQNETETRKKQAREAAAPVFFQVKKGEMIVREGERVSEEQILKLHAMRNLGSQTNTLRTMFALTLSVILLFWSAHLFGLRNIRKYRPDNRDFIFICTTFVGQIILIKLAIFIANALEGAFPYIESTSYHFIIPFAVGAMLVRIVLNSEVALIFSIISAMLVGVLFGNSLSVAFFALAGSLVGAHHVKHCKQRTVLYKAALYVGLVNMGMVLGLHLMSGLPFGLQLLFKLVFAFMGGMLAAVIVTGTIPLVEVVFKYTTDIKLLELANMNAPVLRELMIQAPGTYHHSIIVGNLVEAAAEAINANPLLARVAAYYHDIGKIRKPLYFIENNRGEGRNRHDKLAPSMSALILMAHVKDGIEIGREHKLGQELLDIIRQHHGTTLIKFFYDRAKNNADPEMQQVDERDYRYPGPKPQTREAALIMLADAVEAASRTLTDPTSARIQGMVQKIIGNIFIDGQLDECELTLKDLHQIAKSFNRVLAGIFHQRVDYPEPAYKERDKEQGNKQKKNDDDTHREPPREAVDRDTDAGTGGAEDIKRLGMS
ncbi:MAG: phosphohydrolase [Desulfuromonas sp.]|nr:MAG: phosphohydrolase [Desulfuromonas sp.]